MSANARQNWSDGLNWQKMKRLMIELANLKCLGLNWQKCNRFRNFWTIFPSLVRML